MLDTYNEWLKQLYKERDVYLLNSILDQSSASEEWNKLSGQCTPPLIYRQKVNPPTPMSKPIMNPEFDCFENHELCVQQSKRQKM